jgi:hypothetical protein
MDLNRSTVLVPDSVTHTVERPPEISIRKRGPISDADYSLPKKRRGGRRGALTATQLENFRQAKKQGVCIRCRFFHKQVRLSIVLRNRTNETQCHGGFPCTVCIERESSRLMKTPCTKAEFFDIIAAGSYFSCTCPDITEL